VRLERILGTDIRSGPWTIKTMVQSRFAETLTPTLISANQVSASREDTKTIAICHIKTHFGTENGTDRIGPTGRCKSSAIKVLEVFLPQTL